MVKKIYLKRANSKDSLRNFSWNKDSASVYPDFSFQTVINMINNDPVARGAVNHFVAKCMEGEYHILKRNKNTLDNATKLILEEKYQFRRDILRKTFLLAKLFNNVFIETVRNVDNKTKALNILDSLNIEAITQPNGDLIKCKSRIPNQKSGVMAEWDKKDITWIKYGDRSIGYAPVDLRALYENLLIKDWVKRYVGWLWKTGQYRILYNPKSASDKEIQDFMAYNRRHASNFQAPFIMKGEMEVKIIRDMKETDSITTLLTYLDNQTLVLLRVPPIEAGIPDSSGRSNSDEQGNSESTDIIDLKQIVADSINFDLFPKINKSNSLIIFGPSDIFKEQLVWDNVTKMKGIGMKSEMIEQELKNKGIYFEGDTWFEPLPEMNPQMQDDTAPSRQRKSVGTPNKNIGTGSQSTTRSNQLRKE